MDTNKILSADILDLIFDDRNKEYGAYDLRVTYPQRIKKALIITTVLGGLFISGAILASSFRKPATAGFNIHSVDLAAVPDKVPEKIPEVKKPDVQPPVKTQKLANFQIVDDIIADQVIPEKRDLQDAKIDLKTQGGVDDVGLVGSDPLGDGKGLIEDKKNTEPETWDGPIQFEAKYEGNWEKFLTRNLNAEVPINNGAPEGKYTVMIQFVVDLDGKLSDIKALTSHGYGMEEEAMRVLRKALGWKPGVQNGREVKSYRRQPITFIVVPE
jgi:protein TonB